MVYRSKKYIPYRFADLCFGLSHRLLLLCRPIAIQEVLRESGLALWLDLDYRLTFSDLSSWIDRQALCIRYTQMGHSRVSDPDSVRSVDPDPDSDSGSGSRSGRMN
jgi:hypothetical protein